MLYVCDYAHFGGRNAEISEFFFTQFLACLGKILPMLAKHYGYMTKVFLAYKHS